jgi:riboflavin kinase/FMN adenylyltransferase
MAEVVKVFFDDVICNFSRRPLAMAIGTFDGVHIGHRKLISTTVDYAKRISGIAAVYTFRPHPTFITSLSGPKSMLRGFADKYKILNKYELDYIIEQKFDEEFSKVSSYDFVEFLRRKFPTLRIICVGEDFRFGHGRIGTTDVLTNHARRFGIEVVAVPPLTVNGERVSSSRIRELFQINDVYLANLMLGED